MKKYDGIIFDLDGTLWDSRESISQVWTQVLKNHDVGRTTVSVEDMTKTMGLVLSDIAKLLFPDLDDEYRNRLMDECGTKELEYLYNNGGNLFDKLEDTLEILSKKYKLYIVSNCQDGYIETFLHAHNMSKYFSDYECPGRSGLNKAENCKLIVKRNNLKNAVYVGDTQWDLDSAHEAGIPFVLADYGFGKDIKGYDYIINKLEDLTELF